MLATQPLLHACNPTFVACLQPTHSPPYPEPLAGGASHVGAFRAGKINKVDLGHLGMFYLILVFLLTEADLDGHANNR